MRLMILTLALASSAAANAMPAGEFLTRADALRAKGPLALLSSD